MYRTARQLSEAFADGSDTPFLALERSLEALRHVPAAFISVSAQATAEAEAEASGRRWSKHQPLSPLDGVPVAWKDLIDMAGTVTTSGRKGVTAVARQDAPIVARARAAGMVSVGKTNLSELAYSGLGVNPHHGTPDHAVVHGHVPGGSSSGAAVSVAAGVVPLSIGTDTGGSIRIPAAFNGLVGYRPTVGHYDQAGIQALAPSFDTVGPLAQTVGDIRLFDEVFSGPSGEPAAVPTLAYDHEFLAGLPIQPEVWAGFLAAIERLREAGLEIENRPLTVWRDAFTLVTTAGWPGAVEAYRTHQELLSTPEAEWLDPRVRSRLLLASGVSADHHAQVMARRAELMGRMATEMNVLMLTPTVALTAPALSAVEQGEDFARLNLDTLRFTMIGSLLDQPGVTLPAGADSAGLPYGLLLSAPRHHDAQLLGAAAEVEQRLTPG